MIKKLDAYGEAWFELKEAMRASLEMREAWGSRNLVDR